MEKAELEIKKLEAELGKLVLEKQMLQNEVDTYSERSTNEEKRLTANQKIERNKIWITPIITLIITLGATWIAHILKSQESRSENINEATKTLIGYKAQYDTIINDNRQKLLLTQIIALYPTYEDTSLINLQKPFRISFNKGLGINDSSKALSQIAPAQDSSKYNAIALQNINKSDFVEIQLQNAKKKGDNKSVLILQQDLNQSKLIASKKLPDTINNAINSAGGLSTQILEQLKSLPASTNPQENVIKTYDISWFKVGYYLDFDNMRILLQGLDKQSGIQVQVCEVIENGNCNENNAIITNQLISYNSPLTIIVGDAAYQISLSIIDHAGTNPFKLAAYINVVKLNNTPVLNLASTFVKLYYTSSTASKVSKIDELLKNFNVKFQSSDKPEGYAINGVKYNQIVFYNNDQMKYCQAVQGILKEKGYGHFTLRPSSGFGYQTDHFKIYFVK